MFPGADCFSNFVFKFFENCLANILAKHCLEGIPTVTQRSSVIQQNLKLAQELLHVRNHYVLRMVAFRPAIREHVSLAPWVLDMD